MELPSFLVSKFAKLSVGEPQNKNETTVYGTVRERDGTKFVQIDGAEAITPVLTTVEFEEGERVTVLLKNHTATVTGNITSPASRNATVEIIGSQVSILSKSPIYTGEEPPENPEEGFLWLDTSAEPNVLRQYSEQGAWNVIGTDKLKTSSIDIKNDKIDITSGGSININSGASIAIKSGGTFTVDATNLDIDGKGVITASKAELTEATVNGNITVNGYSVWHAGNIIVGSSEPVNPKVGTIWINPNDSSGGSSGGDSGGDDGGGSSGGSVETGVVLEGTYYASSIGTSHIFTNSNGNSYGSYLEGPSLGSLSSGQFTYTIRLPLYSSNQYGTHFARAKIWSDSSSGSIKFPSQKYDSYGLTWYEQEVTVETEWLGDSSRIYFEVEVAHNDGDFPSSTSGDMQYRKGYSARLTVRGVETTKTRAATGSGWKYASVKYFTG